MTNKETKTLSKDIKQRIDEFFKMHDGSCPETGLYDRIISEVEKVIIERTLIHVEGVQVKASRILGINRNTLRKKMKKFDIN